MEAILYIGISQAFFAGLLIATKKPILLANRILAAWFFLICIEMIIVMINSNLVQLYSIKVLPFTYGPLMYLYAKSMTKPRQTFSYKYLWHFVPFIIFFIVSLIFINKPVMEGTRGFFMVDRFISLRIIYGISFFISITAYSAATFAIIHRHQRHLRSYISYRSSRFTLQWLIGLSVTFYLSYLLVFVFGLIDILNNFMPFDPYELSFLGLTIFAFLYGFYGFKQPAIFKEISGLEANDDRVTEAELKKYSRSGLRKNEAEKIAEQITGFMEREKPYLNRELSITDLSVHLGIPRHFITEVINMYMGKNFYFLINEYRVKEFKEKLKDPASNNLTILAIAFDSGFNSKSAFNSTFKELTGQTPSEYLKYVKRSSEN